MGFNLGFKGLTCQFPWFCTPIIYNQVKLPQSSVLYYVYGEWALTDVVAVLGTQASKTETENIEPWRQCTEDVQVLDSKVYCNSYCNEPFTVLAIKSETNVRFLLGNSPVSEFYMPMFRNTLSVPSPYLPACEDRTDRMFRNVGI